jgi:hypothetical protein
METTKQPEFAVGQHVRLKKPDLMGSTIGKIVEIEKVYQAVKMIHADKTEFDMQGLATLESTISSIKIPFKLDGDILTVTYPSGKTEVFKFHHYAYTVDTGKMLTLVSKKNILSVI